jgi:hypothetical protein
MYCLLAAMTFTGCGSSADEPASPAQSNPNALSCTVKLGGLSPQCQYYEASGTDAEATLSQLAASCVTSSSATAAVVEKCPAENNLGGCRKPRPVTGRTAEVFLTSFFYSAPGTPLYASAKDVEASCAKRGETFVPAP